ncbi:MAG: hypothetical protein FWD76_01690 [Firmicutes bacterium]|nr:hypothetical protein [Bacillota bacterium]
MLERIKTKNGKMVIAISAISMVLLFAVSFGLQAVLKAKSDPHSGLVSVQTQDRLSRQEIDTIAKDEMKKIGFDVIEQQNPLVQKALEIFDDYNQAYDSGVGFVDLMETLQKDIDNLMSYIKDNIGEIEGVDNHSRDELLRGEIWVGLSAGFIVTVVSTMVGSLVAAWVAYLIAMFNSMFAWVYAIPVVGPIIMGALSAVCGFFAGYLFDKYHDGLGGNPIQDLKFKVASAWWLPNWSLIV